MRTISPATIALVICSVALIANGTPFDHLDSPRTNEYQPLARSFHHSSASISNLHSANAVVDGYSGSESSLRRREWVPLTPEYAQAHLVKLQNNAAKLIHQRIIATQEEHGYDGQRALDARIESFELQVGTPEREAAEEASRKHLADTKEWREIYKQVHRFGLDLFKNVEGHTESHKAALRGDYDALDAEYEAGVDAKLAELFGGPEAPIKAV